MLGRTEGLLGAGSALRDLAERLRTLGYEALCRRLDEVASAAFEPATRPLQRFHASAQGPDALALAALFRLRDAVELADARRIVGDGLTSTLIDIGLLDREGARVRSAFELGAHAGCFFLSDDLSTSGDAVMGVGPYTLDLLACAEPRGRVRAALDLGCGAGVLAVLLSARCDRVVATDIHPRAVELTKVNAAFNGVSNVEARAGDLFAPVAGERFDLVVSQPPFIPLSEGTDAAVYADGGRRGDELLQRLLRDLGPHLEGRASIVAQLALSDEESSAERLQGSLAELDVLLLECLGPSLDAISIGNAAYHHPDLGEAFARES
ncbi:MAG: methyltransferase, partial [Polyangiales bacterium]